MKFSIAYLFLFLMAVVFFTACTNPTSDNPSTEKPVEVNPENPTDNTDPEESLGDPKSLNTTEEDFDEFDRNHEKTLYVFALRGLNMRESADLNSKALQVVPFGAKVTVLEHPKKRDMLVDGYSGGMVKVQYEGKTGYMFDGYLARFPVPGDKMQPKEYVEHIKKAKQVAIYHHERLEDDGYIQNTEGLIVPTSSFDEAFLVAKVLFGIPVNLYLPPAGKEPQTIVVNPDKEEYLWSDEIQVNREKSGEIKSIYYYLRGEGGGFTVTIERDDRGMKIAETAIAD